jgi:catechol 2,3-dioxygenase-like lactoylglutathione lyase family enzyme
VRDQEANRKFFEDLLGIPLVATWCEKHHNAQLGREVAMCHTFFGMGDGGALAFFSFADPEIYKLVIAEKPAVIGNFDHVAFKVSDRTYDEIVGRLKQSGETFRENDHGYCKSVYATSPDGLIVEFTVDPPGVEQIDAIRRADAHSELARWVAGDHRTNNDLRPR